MFDENEPSAGKPKLIGMRDLNAMEIRAMNDIAECGNRMGELIENLRLEPGLDDIDQRWILIGKTHLQQGIMALKRAIGRPENF